jgi:hypothetical protein
MNIILILRKLEYARSEGFMPPDICDAYDAWADSIDEDKPADQLIEEAEKLLAQCLPGMPDFQ